MYLPSDNIQAFPTVNSRDNGKLLLEENMYNTVRRITKLNYVYEVNGEDPRDTDINMSLKKNDEQSTYTYHIGIEISTPFKCNIHGYDIQINKGFDIIFKDYSSSEEKNDPRYVYITDNNYGQDKPFGLVLSRVISTQRLKGDSLFNITDNNESKTKYYYRGVMVLYGDDFEAADDDIKLKLGTVSTFKRSDNNVTVIGLIIDYNTLIIDGSTVGIKQEDNYISLTEYLNNDYVSKLGDTYHDKKYNIPANISDLSDSEKELIDNSNNKQPKQVFMNGIEYYIPPFFNPYSDDSSVSLIERRSDMYGSLTFRNFDNSTNYEISIGCNNQSHDENEVDINNPYISSNGYHPLRGIKLRTSSKSGEGPRDYMDIGLFNIYNYTKISRVKNPITALGFNKLVIGETDDTEEYESQHFYTEDDEIDIGSGTSKVCISVGENTPTWQKCHEFFHSEDNQKFGTIFNEDKVEFIYNKNSEVQITCNEEKSEIEFGNDESTNAMMIDYDLENSNLSVNNKLGSLGVPKFCDGKCVDNNPIYSSDPATNDPPYSFEDLPYNYEDKYVPNSLSKIINESTTDLIRYYYLNPNSYFKNFATYNYDYTAITINPISSESLLTFMESNYGWHVYKNGDFLPGHGAFDTIYDGNYEKIKDSYNSYVPDSYKYLSRYDGHQRLINTYDYFCCRYKIDPSAYGKYLLINNMQEWIQAVQDLNVISTDKTPFNKDNINVYFCRTYHDGDTNTIRFGFNRKPTINDIDTYDDNVNTYTLIGDINNDGIKTYDKITGVSNGKLNHFIQIPTDISDNDDLFVIFSTTVLSFNKINHIHSLYLNNNHLNYGDIKSPGNSQEASYTNRGEYIILGHNVNLGIVDDINNSQVIIKKDDLVPIPGTSRYRDINNPKLLIPDFECDLHVHHISKDNNNNYNYRPTHSYDLYYDYETSKYYKSLRIHGFYSAAQTKNTTQGDHNPGNPSNFKYYRLVYALGFETSNIIIEKIKVYFNNPTNSIYLYKLYREDEENIVFSAKNTSMFRDDNNNNLNAKPYSYYKKYFYINNLNLNNITGTNAFFLGTDIDFLDEYYINSEDYKDDILCSEFYKQDNNNQYITHQVSIDYPINNVYHNKWWFIKDLFITNISSINFSTMLNKFNVNVDAHLNETTYVNKLMFGEDEDLSISMSNKQVRFVFPEDENNYKPIIFNNNGITFSNHGDYSEKDVTISKVKEGSTFDGLNVSGDFRADRVFNAVYNDYADNVKCSKVTEYEPGDIICKDPYSDEYVLSNSDLKRLVVGVYSDTYGHLLGGDKNESMEENSKKYVPIAVAGNVRVKVTGFIQVGDLIRASNIPGVGEKALSPELGTIIGKALESKDDDYYGVKRILMQVMLL